MRKNEFWTIPNMITSYRLIVFPLILYFALTGKENLYVTFIVINLVTDFLDGYIARKLHMETEIGATLDSFADNLTYLLAFTGLLIFKADDLRPRLVSFIIYMAMAALPVAVSLVRYRKIPRFHTYMFKYSGYIQLAFFLSIFTIGFIAPLYYFMIVWVITASVEHIAIQTVLPEMRSNIKGLYWVLRERKKEKGGDS